MDTIFGENARFLQSHFGTLQLADKIVETFSRIELNDEYVEMIETASMVFLGTVDHDDFPDVSYKGGLPGFIHVIDSHTIRIPSYDGNGFFRSLGNIMNNGKVSLLFICFDGSRKSKVRVRMHGVGRVLLDAISKSKFTGAEAVIEVKISRLFPNCPRYLPLYSGTYSEYCPVPGIAPPIPDWKRMPEFSDVLTLTDQALLNAH